MGGVGEDHGDAVMSLALLQRIFQAFEFEFPFLTSTYTFQLRDCAQNKIKRDPEAYREEFLLQLSNFQGLLASLKQQPHRPTKKLQSLAMFLAHVGPYTARSYCVFCVAECAEAADSWTSGSPGSPEVPPVFDAFAPEQSTPLGSPSGGPTLAAKVKEAMQQLLANLELHPTTRHALLNATLLLRSKKMLSCEELLQQSLSLLCLNDKFVRQKIMGFVVKDVSMVFSATTNNQVYRNLNAKVQAANNSIATKLVNAVAGATLADDGRLASSAALFLLGEIQAAAAQASHAIRADEGEGEEEVAAAAAAELQQHSALASKKTLAAKKKLKKQKQRMQKRLMRKQQRAEQQREHMGTAACAAILDLIYDPHSLAEKLFSVCANLVHAAVPPQEVLPLVKDIANNFVNDTRGEEVVTVGINAITEICSRNPLAMTEDLLSDLLQYSKYKTSKSVSAAARGLLNLYRETHPAMLPKAYLGKEAAIQLQRDNVSLPEFGAFRTSQNLALLPQLEALKKRSRQELEQELGVRKVEDAEESEEDETQDKKSEGEEEIGEEEDNNERDTDAEEETEEEVKEESEEEEEGTEEEEGQNEDTDTEEPQRKKRRLQAAASSAAANTAAAEDTATAATAEEARGDVTGGGARLLTDADFAALRLLRAKQLVQQIRGGPRRGGGCQIDTERDLKLLKLIDFAKEGDGEASEIESDSSDSDASDGENAGGEQESAFVSERDLEGLAGRKRRQARERNRMREEKLQNKKEGINTKWPQEQKEKKGSKPQYVKNRSKPLLMVQQSRRLREKKQLSVHDKAANLKKRIKNLKKSQVGKPRRRKR